MKKILCFAGVLCLVTPLLPPGLAQTARILSRPLYTDTASAGSRSAILIELSGYPVNEARYRLFKGSTQYQCWDTVSRSYVTSTSYASGPLAMGFPSITTTFWIAFQRGSNNSSTATYRDRLGPDFKENFRDVILPPATRITSPYTLSGILLAGDNYPLSKKYVVLAFSGSDLIAASHSDTLTGVFSVVCPDVKTTDRLEVKTLTNVPVGQKTGVWSSVNDVGSIQLSLINSVERTSFRRKNDDQIRLYPVPASAYFIVEGSRQIERVEVLDMSGKLLIDCNCDLQESATVNISGLPPGAYCVRIISNGQKFVRIIVKA